MAVRVRTLVTHVDGNRRHKKGDEYVTSGEHARLKSQRGLVEVIEDTNEEPAGPAPVEPVTSRIRRRKNEEEE